MVRRRGFTLLEITMTVAMIAVFTGMAILHISRGRHRAGAQGLVQVVGEELRRVRQEAIAGRRPMALVFPTDGGRFSATRSFYVLSGEAEPRIIRSRNFNSEFAGADIFMGRWPLLSGNWSAAQPVVPGSKWADFSVNDWLPPVSPARQDYCFVFLPDGTVRTNGLLSHEDRYHLAVASGTSYSPSASNATLTGSGEAYTISISPVGGISQSSGLLGSNASLQTSGRFAKAATHTAPRPDDITPLPPTPINGNPKIYPEPKPETLPNDTDALITKDQYVSLDMQAVSDSGEQLFCQWKVTQEGGGSKTGAFSMQSQSTGTGAGGRMEWDQSLRGGRGAWKATWQWRPPVNAQPSERYRLACEVQNIKTGEKKVEIKKFEITPPGKVLFQSNRRGPEEIWTMDESGQRERAYLAHGEHPTATLDGSRIIYVRKADRHLCLHFPQDPGNDIELTNFGDCSLPSISPSGNFVAFFRGDDLKVMKVAKNAVDVGIAPNILSQFPANRRLMVKVGWSSDGTNLLYGLGNRLMSQPIFADNSGRPNPGVAVEISHGTGLVSSATGNIGTSVVHYTDDYAPNYDPWMKRSDSDDRQYLSIGFEDASVERSPRGPTHIMITRGPAPVVGDRQIRIVTLPGNVGPPLTSAGSNTRPVWTQ
jgi:prepilin-type N-terminal cleavage/methylation domain-containing protein